MWLHCRSLIAGAILAALLFFSGQTALAQNLTSGTTVYGTGQAARTWQGGTISAGATLRLDNGAAVTAARGNPFVSGTLQFNETTRLTLSSTIQGAGTLSLTNTGTLNLTGAIGRLPWETNTIVLNMTTSASAGLLQIRSGTGMLNVGDNGTGTLNVTGGNVTSQYGILGYSAGSNGTATVSSGTWANSTALTVGYQGTGTLNVTGGYVSSGSGQTDIGSYDGSAGTATVASGTWANDGNLVVGNSGTGTLTVDGGSVTNTNGTIGSTAGSVGTATVSSGTWANSGNLTVGLSGTGTLTMNGGLVSVGGTLSSGTAGTINLNAGGTLQIGTGGTTGVLLGGTGSLANNGTLIFNRSDASTYSGSLSGSGAVTKQGAGTLTLSGSNTYSGATTISGGVLAYGASNALSDSTAVTVAGGTLNLDSYTDTVATFAITSGSLAGSGKLTAATYALGGGTVTGNLGSGTMTVTANSSLSGTADVTAVSLSAGTLTLGSAGRFTSDQVALTGSSGASLSLGGSESIGSLAGGFNVALGSGTFTTGNDNTSTTYAGVLSGSGGLTKAGSGMLSLTGSNTYTGVTTLSAGELKVNGSTGTGALTVASAAILSGTGTIGGATTISGTHMPGNSPGIQSFTSDLTYAQIGLTGPKIFWELAGNTTSNSPLAYDQIDVGGNLNFGAGTGLWRTGQHRQLEQLLLVALAAVDVLQRFGHDQRPLQSAAFRQ